MGPEPARRAGDTARVEPDVVRRSASGMTLLEVLLAVSITAVVVLLLVGGLRIGLRAWEAGERQAAAQQGRGAIVELVRGALAAAYP